MPDYSVADVTYGGVPVGKLWTDNETVIDYNPVDPDDSTVEAIKRVGVLLSSARKIGLKPDLAFAGILQVLSKDQQFAYEQSTSPTLEDEPQYFQVTDENGTVVGMTVDSDAEGDKVRENGQWVDPTGPDDERAFGPSTPVDESAVAAFDAGSTSTPQPEEAVPEAEVE